LCWKERDQILKGLLLTNFGLPDLVNRFAGLTPNGAQACSFARGKNRYASWLLMPFTRR